MIEPNFTAIANMTEEFNETALSLSGSINGTTPIELTFSHIPSVVVSQPSFNFVMEMQMIQTICILSMTMMLIYLTYREYKGRV